MNGQQLATGVVNHAHYIDKIRSLLEERQNFVDAATVPEVDIPSLAGLAEDGVSHAVAQGGGWLIAKYAPFTGQTIQTVDAIRGLLEIYKEFAVALTIEDEIPELNEALTRFTDQLADNAEQAAANLDPREAKTPAEIRDTIADLQTAQQEMGSECNSNDLPG